MRKNILSPSILAADFTCLGKDINEAVAAGMTTSAAIRQIASETGVSKNKIYELVHQQEN